MGQVIGLTQISQMGQIDADGAYSTLTQQVIGLCFDVHRELGSGFLENIYRNALLLALKQAHLDAKQEVPFDVRFRGTIVGEFRADLIVNDALIVEVKAVSTIAKAHEVQLVNYLSATGLPVGLLINFGGSVQVKRKIMSKNLRQSAPSAKSASKSFRA